MATDVRTLNLSDNGDGMVPLNNNQGTSFVPNIPPEKNVSENKQTMDSTSISDIMGQVEEPLEPPMMGTDPRMTQMQMQAPMMAAQQPVVQQTTEKQPESKNPFNLTDDQIGKHTSELQSHHDLVCRLLLEKKKNIQKQKKHKLTPT